MYMLSNHFRLNLLFLSALLVGQGLWAQDEEALPDVFRSPYEAVYNHLKYLQEGNRIPAQSAKSLFKGNRTEKEIEQLAIELKQIFDGSGNWIRLEDIPKAANYRDSLTQRQRYILTDDFPDIYIQKYREQWLFSDRTVSEIDAIHKRVYPYGSYRLLNILPKLGNNELLGLHLWQYLGILMLIIFGFIIHLVFSFFVGKVLFRAMQRYGRVEFAKELLIPAAKPFSLMFWR